MLSYWEQQHFLQYDFIIIGAGIMGLNTAIELADSYPNRRILILERGFFPAGASTRNAGFAAIGSATELLEDLKTLSEEAVADLCAGRQEGLRILRGRLGDKHIGYHARGSYELIPPENVSIISNIPLLNRLLEGISPKKKPVFRLANDKIKPFGFDAGKVSHLIENTQEGEIHTGMMMRRLADLAISKGIEIKTGAEATRFEEEKNETKVWVDGNIPSAGTIALTCSHLFICTNAFTPQLLPDTDVKPGRGQVLVTQPIAGIPFKGIFHFDRGYYYFREINGRILFGGGRNLDFDKEATTSMELNEYIQQDLERKLRELILPGRKVEIAMRWSGIMAFGSDKNPIVKSFGRRVHGAFRFSGMGVALSSIAARQLVSLIKNN